MKKIFIIMLVLCSFVLPVFAGQLQTEYEQKYLAEFDDGKDGMDFFVTPLRIRKYFFSEDYEIYLKSGSSVYGDFVEHRKSLSSQDVLDKKYMTLVLDNINKCVVNKDYKGPCEYVSIEDEDYQKLKEKTKEYIAEYNLAYVYVAD